MSIILLAGTACSELVDVQLILIAKMFVHETTNESKYSNNVLVMASIPICRILYEYVVLVYVNLHFTQVQKQTFHKQFIVSVMVQRFRIV